MSYDLVIKNGTVIDGSGLPRYRADVGVRHGRITTIGRIRERAREVMETLPVYYGPVYSTWHMRPPLRHPMHHQRLNGNAWPGFGRQ